MKELKGEKPLSNTESYFEVPTENNFELPVFLKKLMNGDFGLPFTYWGIGVILGNIITALLGTIIQSDGVLFLLLLPFYIPVSLGIWRASNKYKGAIIWANLAKTAVFMSGVILFAGIVNMFFN